MKKDSKIPSHIVLFPDGNRRWAKERGIDTMEGHKEGYKRLLDFSIWCKDRGVKTITAFGFSTENWKRPKAEVTYLMRLLENGFKQNFLKDSPDPRKIKDLGVRLRVIGERDRLSGFLKKAIEEAEEFTKDNNELFLNLAISYGGRWDIVQATQKIVKDGISPDKITEELFSSYLSTAGLPDPDLVIRAGGEKRFSNFVLWQSAYSELFFYPKYWPDFTEQDLDKILKEYDERQRRFGK